MAPTLASSAPAFSPQVKAVHFETGNGFEIHNITVTNKSLLNKKYIVWYAKVTQEKLKNPWFKRWWLAEVLTHGRAEDISQLDFKEVRLQMPMLHLPTHVRSLWTDYFVNHPSA